MKPEARNEQRLPHHVEPFLKKPSDRYCSVKTTRGLKLFGLNFLTTKPSSMSVPITDPNAPGSVPSSLPAYGVYAPPPAYGGPAVGPAGQPGYAYDPAHYTQYKAHKGTI